MTTLITLNLLAEEQIALQRRARDPFKFALAIGVALVALAVGAGVLATMGVNRKEAEVAVLETRLKEMGEGAIAEREVLYQWTKSLAEDVVTLNKSRVRYAEQMALVKDIVPANVQLTYYGLTVSSETAAPMPTIDDDGGTAKPTKAARPKKAERLVLKLDGRAFGSPPELVVDEFLKSLRENPALKANLEDVQLRSIARVTSSPTESAPVNAAAFVIECQFKERS